MHSLVATVLVVGVFSVIATAIADERDDARARFTDDLIENLVGQWKVSRQVGDRSVTNDLEARWVLEHQFLQIHMRDVRGASEYEALVLVGCMDPDKEYVAHWCDTFGGAFSSLGKGRRSGNAIAFEFPYSSGPFFNTWTWDPETKGWTFRMEQTDAHGKRVPFALDKLRRP